MHLTPFMFPVESEILWSANNVSDSVQVVAINRVLVLLAPSSGHISRVTSPSAELTPFGTAPAPYRPLNIGIELFNFDIDVNRYIYTVAVEQFQNQKPSPKDPQNCQSIKIFSDK